DPIHVAVKSRAVLNRQNVPGLVTGSMQRPPQAELILFLPLGGVPIAMEGPDAGPLAEARLAEDEVPRRVGIQVARCEGEVSESIIGAVRLQHLVEDVGAQNLLATPSRMNAL